MLLLIGQVLCLQILKDAFISLLLSHTKQLQATRPMRPLGYTINPNKYHSPCQGPKFGGCFVPPDAVMKESGSSSFE
ncbi:unnamed protein product [Dovyalis caffra]|uniref:Uncharacterized protein n=1 Tax=Dovyalis caffra TaxID=77055 RepID=A0AAV1SSX9_9ROSI|nr:unnamed protein product [Dovyalis caffra]